MEAVVAEDDGRVREEEGRLPWEETLVLVVTEDAVLGRSPVLMLTLETVAVLGRGLSLNGLLIPIP